MSLPELDKTKPWTRTNFTHIRPATSGGPFPFIFANFHKLNKRPSQKATSMLVK